jgi:hypothetical protein
MHLSPGSSGEEGPGHPRSGRQPPQDVPPALLWERKGEVWKTGGTRIIFKQPTAVQWLGKLGRGLSQGAELTGAFPSACWEREGGISLCAVREARALTPLWGIPLCTLCLCSAPLLSPWNWPGSPDAPCLWGCWRGVGALSFAG